MARPEQRRADGARVELDGEARCAGPRSSRAPEPVELERGAPEREPGDANLDPRFKL